RPFSQVSQARQVFRAPAPGFGTGYEITPKLAQARGGPTRARRIGMGMYWDSTTVCLTRFGLPGGGEVLQSPGKPTFDSAGGVSDVRGDRWTPYTPLLLPYACRCPMEGRITSSSLRRNHGHLRHPGWASVVSRNEAI